MSQSVNLYRISRDEFQKFSLNKNSYNFNFSNGNSSVFDQNFEGLNFLFLLYYKEQLPEVLKHLFYPQEFVGEEIDFEEIDYDNLDDFPESNAIYFLNPERVTEVDTILNIMDNEKVINFYNSDNFNLNDIYPTTWHNNESEDQAFNKKHLEEGLNLLKKTISQASKNEDYILYFRG